MEPLAQPTKEGLVHIIIYNKTRYSIPVGAGMVIGESTGMEIVEEKKSVPHDLVLTSIPTLEKWPLVVQNIKSVDDCK